MQISFKFIDWKEPSTFLICLDKRHNVTDEEREQVKYWHDYIDRGKSHTPCTKNEVFALNISSVNVTKFAGNCEFGHICWRSP